MRFCIYTPISSTKKKELCCFFYIYEKRPKHVPWCKWQLNFSEYHWNTELCHFMIFFYGWHYLFYSASHLLVWVTPCFQRKDWVWIRVYPLLLQVHCSYRYTVTIKLLIIYLFPGGGAQNLQKFWFGFFVFLFFLQFKMFIMAINTGYNICILYFLLSESHRKRKQKSDLCKNNWI